VIGPLEIGIILLIVLVIFGAKFLPQLGRSAGKGVRIGTEKGKELAAVAQEKAKDVDTKALARQAGDHVREARELRDVVKGESKPAPTASEQAAEPAASKPAPEAPEQKAPDASEQQT
jgi:sec-independent protein translocase protein TatA